MDQHEHVGGRPPAEPAVTVRHLVTLFVWAAALALLFYFPASIQVLFLGVLGAACLVAALHPLMRYVPAGRRRPRARLCWRIAESFGRR